MDSLHTLRAILLRTARCLGRTHFAFGMTLANGNVTQSPGALAVVHHPPYFGYIHLHSCKHKTVTLKLTLTRTLTLTDTGGAVLTRRSCCRRVVNYSKSAQSPYMQYNPRYLYIQKMCILHQCIQWRVSKNKMNASRERRVENKSDNTSGSVMEVHHPVYILALGSGPRLLYRLGSGLGLVLVLV